MSSKSFIESADSRETSKKVMMAILSVAEGDEDYAIKIWEAPTPAETSMVRDLVTEHGKLPASDYCWGAAGSKWAD